MERHHRCQSNIPLNRRYGTPFIDHALSACSMTSSASGRCQRQRWGRTIILSPPTRPDTLAIYADARAPVPQDKVSWFIPRSKQRCSMVCLSGSTLTKFILIPTGKRFENSRTKYLPIKSMKAILLPARFSTPVAGCSLFVGEKKI